MADPQVRAVVRGLERLTERIMIGITLDLTANLVETTPVDTGWARANWVPAIGVPFTEDQGDFTPTPADAASAAGDQQSAVAGVTRYRLSRGSVFVSNNASYIVELNSGKSTQAPAGFVQRSIAKAVTVDIRKLAT